MVWKRNFLSIMRIFGVHISFQETLYHTLLETNSEFTPENGWLEDDPFLLGRLPGGCELLVLRSLKLSYLNLLFQVQTPGHFL